RGTCHSGGEIGRQSPDFRDPCGRTLSPTAPRSDHAGGGNDAVLATMSYLELLKLAASEAIVLVAALVVLTIGLVSGRRGVGVSVSVAGPGDRPNALAGDTSAATSEVVSPLVAAIGLVFAAAAVLQLPSHATLFHGMLVISPLNSLFKTICLTLAFFTVFLAHGEHALPNKG